MPRALPPTKKSFLIAPSESLSNIYIRLRFMMGLKLTSNAAGSNLLSWTMSSLRGSEQ